MDIRTKLVFAYVVVALGCMLALGTATYVEVGGLLRTRALEHLDGLAATKRDALDVIISGWRERISTLARRTALVESLREGAGVPPGARPGVSARLGRVLADVVGSSRAVALLAVYDTAGSLLARAGEGSGAGTLPDRVPWTGAGVVYRGADASVPSAPRVAFTAPLELEGGRLGTLYAELIAEGLVGLTSTYAGLGETGETLVVAPLDAERATVLHPVRFPASMTGTVALGPDSADPFSQALAGSENTRWEEATDYRSTQVWAATRHVSETGWGLVVKMDGDEERQPIEAFRGRLVQLGLSLSAFAILVGTFLGLKLAKPIHDLAAVADQIRDGALSARAVVATEDEVGLLARTFNEMADELERRMTSLQEYRKFFDVSLDMLCIAGTDGFFKQTNPSFERVLGWTNEELTRRPFLDIIHPDDVQPTLQELEKLAEGIPTVSFVNRFQCADGTYKRLRWTSYPEPETGRLYAVAHEIGEEDPL